MQLESYLQAMNNRAPLVCENLRQGNEGFSNRDLGWLAQQLDEIIVVTPQLFDEHLKNLTKVMLNARERHDYLFVADIIEYELIPYINQKASKLIAQP